MSKTKLRNHFRPHARVQFTGELTNPFTGEVTTPPSMTKQSFVQECDINNILKQFSATGMLSHVRQGAAAGRYEDLPDQIDFQDSMNTIRSAEAAFATLPSKVRREFGDEPSNLLAALGDPAQRDRLTELGILSAPPPATAPTPSPEQAPKAAGKPEKGLSGD